MCSTSKLMRNRILPEYLIYFDFWVMNTEIVRYLPKSKINNLGSCKKLWENWLKIASAQFLVFQNLIQRPITNSTLIIACKWFSDIINIVNIWKSANFSGSTSHSVYGAWAPWNLWDLHFNQRYLKWRNTFDTICLNFFYMFDGPIFVDLHQVEIRNIANILQ